MKVLTNDCKVAKRIREVEDILRDKGISISFRSDGLLIDVDDKTYIIVDDNTRDILPMFPTDVEPTNIQTIENYINGN